MSPITQLAVFKNPTINSLEEEQQKTSKNKFNTKTIICICLGDAGYAGGEHRLWDDGGTLSWQDCSTVHKFPLENSK